MCIGVGSGIAWMPRYGHRSEPHTHVAEILMMASVGFMIFGVSRSSKRIGRAEFSRELLPRFVTTYRDDPLGPHLFGG